MEMLFPAPVEAVDPVALYAADARPAHADRPWVVLNMIASVDGGISVDGVSQGLGGPGDKAVFRAIRGIADVILVASGTVLAENYRKPQTPPAIQEQRVARGQHPVPSLAIVTGTLSVPPSHRVFEGNRPTLITHRAAPADRRDALRGRAELIDAGEDRIDLTVALQELADRGAGVVLLEGGPTLNGHMIADDLIDEVCLSVSPMLLGGGGDGIATGGDRVQPVGLQLKRILHQDGLTFHRWVRA